MNRYSNYKISYRDSKTGEDITVTQQWTMEDTLGVLDYMQGADHIVHAIWLEDKLIFQGITQQSMAMGAIA